MKRIKVIAILFVLFSASMMNYHEQYRSSVNFSDRIHIIQCSGKIQAQEINPCPKSEADYSGTDKELSSGKNYEATMVIM